MNNRISQSIFDAALVGVGVSIARGGFPSPTVSTASQVLFLAGSAFVISYVSQPMLRTAGAFAVGASL